MRWGEWRLSPKLLQTPNQNSYHAELLGQRSLGGEVGKRPDEPSCEEEYVHIYHVYIIYIYNDSYVHVCVCISMYISICMYVCMYVYIYVCSTYMA